MGTFFFILLGTITGEVLIGASHSGASLAGGAVICIALLGRGGSLRIPPLARAASELRVRVNPVLPTLEILRRAKRVRSVFLSILGISCLWFLGAAVLSLIPVYCSEILHGCRSLITRFPALLSMGVGIGSLLRPRLRSGKLELGVVCIFPGGKITGNGGMTHFRPGVEWIMEEMPVPVVPMALNGLWGSFFSKKDGKPMSKPFRRFWSRVSLDIGPQVPAEQVTAHGLQKLVAGLQTALPERCA